MSRGIGKLVLVLLGLVILVMFVGPRFARCSRCSAIGTRAMSVQKELLTGVDFRENKGLLAVNPNDCTNLVQYAQRVMFDAGFVSESWVSSLFGQESPLSIAVNVPSNAPASFPVMISSNFNPKDLPRTWLGSSDPRANDRIILEELGSHRDLVEVAVQRKDGSFSRIAAEKKSFWKPEYVTLRQLLPDAYDLPDDFYFLTASGRVYPSRGQTPAAEVEKSK